MSMILINESYDMRTIALVCRYLRKGYAVLVRTDTQWGLMSLDPAILYEIKKRPLDKKLVKLVSPRFKFYELSLQQKMFVEHFWPGSVTIIKDGHAFRMTNRRFVNAVILALGRSVYCTSANVSGGDPITSVQEALTIFAHASDKLVGVMPYRMLKNPDWEHNIPSTIVDIDLWYVVRKGLRYEEVVSFIANQIIPSFEEQQKAIYEYNQQFIAKTPSEFDNNYVKMPVIDVNPGLAEYVRKRNDKIATMQYLREQKKLQANNQDPASNQEDLSVKKKPTRKEIRAAKKAKDLNNQNKNKK